MGGWFFWPVTWASILYNNIGHDARAGEIRGGSTDIPSSATPCTQVQLTTTAQATGPTIACSATQSHRASANHSASRREPCSLRLEPDQTDDQNALESDHGAERSAYPSTHLTGGVGCSTSRGQSSCRCLHMPAQSSAGPGQQLQGPKSCAGTGSARPLVPSCVTRGGSRVRAYADAGLFLMRVSDSVGVG